MSLRPRVLSALPPLLDREKRTHGGLPTMTSVFGRLFISSIDVPKSRTSFTLSLRLWFKLWVLIAGDQLSIPITTSKPCCRKPSEKPPAPQKKSMTCSLFFIKFTLLLLYLTGNPTQDLESHNTTANLNDKGDSNVNFPIFEQSLDIQKVLYRCRFVYS